MIEQARTLLERIYNNPRLGASLTLGNGCERIAYKLTDDLVVKISKEAMFHQELLATYKEDAEIFKYSRALWDFAMEDQSELEIHIYNELSEEEKKIFNPILGIGTYNGHTFIVSPIVQTAREFGCRTIEGLAHKTKLEFDMSLLKKVCYRNDLEYADLVENSGNFGVSKEGNIVLIDYGLREMKI